MNLAGLGKRINAARKEMGITSEKLSEMCDINATYLRQIESGMKVPSLPVFVTICNQLNVTPTYLLRDSMNESPCGDIDMLNKLIDKATPNQLRLIMAMIESALNNI